MHLNGYLYVPDAGGISGRYDEDTLDALSDIRWRKLAHPFLSTKSIKSTKL